MNIKQVQHAKKSVAKVMGVHRSFYYKEPYNQHEDVQFGGTSFFVNPVTAFGKNLIPRVAALLDVSQVSDIIKIEGEDLFLLEEEGVGRHHMSAHMRPQQS